MNTRITTVYLSTILLTLASVTVCQTAWPQEKESSYQMSVVLDRAHGDSVSEGKYKRAIMRIGARDNRFPFAKATNLCVAHTMVGQFKHAEHFCDEAIAEAEKAAATGRGKNRDHAAEWAMAYSNRGVLRARTGDLEGASSDFGLAIEKQSGTELPVHNMAVMKQAGTEVMAKWSPEDQN